MPTFRASRSLGNTLPKTFVGPSQLLPYKVVPPSDVSWFLNHRNSIDISTIILVIGVIGTNLANELGHHLVCIHMLPYYAEDHLSNRVCFSMLSAVNSL